MYLIKKLKKHGYIWFCRRIVRELMSPTTSIGKYLKPASFIVYYFFNKPINFIYSFNKNNKDNKSLYLFYDFDIEPITYDFAWALCIANAKRNKLNLSYLHVILVPGTVNGLREETPDYEEVVGSDARNWRVYSILLPIIKLLPCSYGITFCYSREMARRIKENQAQYIYPEKYNVTFPMPYVPKHAMEYKKEFPSLQADPHAIKYITEWLGINVKDKKLVTISLRQYSYVVERNSNIKAWAQFANAVDPKDYFIVFIPDTEQALFEVPPELKPFNFFQPASWNVLLRSALYQLAYLNLGVNTGPMSLCWLNPRCRYITFKTTLEDVPQVSMAVMIEKGFLPHKNPPFANEFQKWVWDDDVFSVIFNEFNHMCLKIEKKSIRKTSKSFDFKSQVTV